MQKRDEIAPIPGPSPAGSSPPPDAAARRGRQGFTRRLTSLISLEELEHRLGQEVERALRGGRQVAVGVLALADDSRPPRDQVAAAVVEVFRFEDHVCFDPGGDVVVVLPDTGDQALVPLERLLRRLEEGAPDARGGLAICPDHAVAVEDLLVGARLAARDAAAGEVCILGARQRPRQVGDGEVVAQDPAMLSVLDLVERLAGSDLPVLLSGETGVGKEVLAQALHSWSPRRTSPFVSINCGAVSEALFESELFGHVKGAFTGAVADKVGYFQSAGDGTLLLDEIGECPLTSQAKLLRVLETRRASPVGSVVEQEVRARIVASTNRDLEAEVAAGRFRRDLYYRLNAARVVVPPLRERPLDISPLARRFLAEAGARTGRGHVALARDAVQLLGLYRWPGNVRELKNVMSFVATISEGSEVRAADLPPEITTATPPWYRGGAPQRREQSPPSQAPRRFRPLREEIAELERTRMIEALRATGGERKSAAALLDMPLRTFVAKLKTHAIDIPPRRGRSARPG